MKKVRFSLHQSEVFPVLSHEDMSDEEKLAVWLTDREKKKIEHSLLKTIKSIRTNGHDCRRCIRGLEHMVSPEHVEQREIIKECSAVSVLREQQRQKSIGICDPEEIRKMSESASEWSKNMALTLGRADASEAEKLLADVRKIMEIIKPKSISSSCLHQDFSRRKHSTQTNKYASPSTRTQEMASTTLSQQKQLSLGSSGPRDQPFGSFRSFVKHFSQEIVRE